VMSGTQHTLTAAAPGITITATVTSSDSNKTKAGLGSEPQINDLLTKGELSGQFGNTATNIFNMNALNPSDAKKDPGKPTSNPVSGSIKDSRAPGVEETGTQISFAGSLGLIITNFTAKAEVQPDAVLKSATNITVEATIKETEQTSTEATISKPDK